MLGFAGLPAIGAIGAVVLGAAFCFLGYRLFRLTLGIAGFVVGGFLAGSLAFALSGGSPIVTLIAAIVGAIVGALLVSAFYYVGVFVLGAAAGWMLGSVVTSLLGSPVRLIVAVVLAVLCAILAIVFQRIIIIVATASLGSWGIVAGLYSLMTGVLFPPSVFWNPVRRSGASGGGFLVLFVVWILLAVLGILVQIRFGKRPRGERGPT